MRGEQNIKICHDCSVLCVCLTVTNLPSPYVPESAIKLTINASVNLKFFVKAFLEVHFTLGCITCNITRHSNYCREQTGRSQVEEFLQDVV